MHIFVTWWLLGFAGTIIHLFKCFNKKRGLQGDGLATSQWNLKLFRFPSWENLPPTQVDKWKAKAEALDEVAFMVGVWRVQIEAVENCFKKKQDNIWRIIAKQKQDST